MNSQESPLGRTGFFVIPIAIGLVVVFKSFWTAVEVGAFLGLLIANVKAVLYIGRMQAEVKRNPLLELQEKVKGVNTSTKIQFIFIQSIIGGLVFAIFTAIAAGIANFLR